MAIRIKKGKNDIKQADTKYFPTVKKMKVGDEVELDNNWKEQMDFYNAVYAYRNFLYRSGEEHYNILFRSKKNKAGDKRTFRRIA